MVGGGVEWVCGYVGMYVHKRGVEVVIEMWILQCRDGSKNGG